MINNFYIEAVYAFSLDVAGACTYGSDDKSKSAGTKKVVTARSARALRDGISEMFSHKSRIPEIRSCVLRNPIALP
jgi:hypothetical protein